MTLLNEIPLSESPPGALFVKTHISVIAAEAFNVYMSWGSCKVQSIHAPPSNSSFVGTFEKYLPKSALWAIMGHDSLHCEHQAKLRKERRAAKEQVVWFRWSWRALGHGRHIQPFQTGVNTPAKVLTHIISTVDQHWVTRTLHFHLIKIKGSLSHMQAVLKISQYGNKVVDGEDLPEATGTQCEVMCIKAAALQKGTCTSTVPGALNPDLQVLTVEYKAAWKSSSNILLQTMRVCSA